MFFIKTNGSQNFVPNPFTCNIVQVAKLAILPHIFVGENAYSNMAIILIHFANTNSF